MYIPGFRSKNKFKMAVASLYYLLSVLMVTQGLAIFLFMLSIPFIIFSGIDLLKKKNSKSVFILIVSCVIFIFSMAIAPRDNRVAARSSNSPKTTLNEDSSNTEVPVQTTAAAPSPAVSPESSNTTSDVSGKLTIHFLDVGQADSILIMQDKFSMLIDGGNNADSEMVTKYIKDQGITKLDYVIGTHPHEDHIGGLDAVINSFDIGSKLCQRLILTQRRLKTYCQQLGIKGSR
jgi:competence protein ComEC